MTAADARENGAESRVVRWLVFCFFWERIATVAACQRFMPTYEYSCEKCGKALSRSFQSMRDESFARMSRRNFAGKKNGDTEK